MKNRKKLVMEEINSLLEKRYLDKKFLLKEEDKDDLPEFQVTPEGMGKYKIKFTWKLKGVNLPKDVRDSELFTNPEFEPLKKIYANEDGKEEATKVINDFIKTKTYLFKKL